jgi:hypothetical protein
MNLLRGVRGLAGMELRVLDRFRGREFYRRLGGCFRRPEVNEGEAREQNDRK